MRVGQPFVSFCLWARVASVPAFEPLDRDAENHGSHPTGDFAGTFRRRREGAGESHRTQAKGGSGSLRLASANIVQGRPPIPNRDEAVIERSLWKSSFLTWKLCLPLGEPALPYPYGAETRRRRCFGGWPGAKSEGLMRRDTVSVRPSPVGVGEAAGSKSAPTAGLQVCKLFENSTL